MLRKHLKQAARHLGPIVDQLIQHTLTARSIGMEHPLERLEQADSSATLCQPEWPDNAASRFLKDAHSAAKAGGASAASAHRFTFPRSRPQYSMSRGRLFQTCIGQVKRSAAEIILVRNQSDQALHP